MNTSKNASFIILIILAVLTTTNCSAENKDKPEKFITITPLSVASNVSRYSTAISIVAKYTDKLILCINKTNQGTRQEVTSMHALVQSAIKYNDGKVSIKGRFLSEKIFELSSVSTNGLQVELD